MGNVNDDRTLSCHEVRLRLSLYIAGDPSLLDTEKGELQDHLAACSACRLDYEESKRLIGFLQGRWGALDARTMRALARRNLRETNEVARATEEGQSAEKVRGTDSGGLVAGDGHASRSAWRRAARALAVVACLLVAVGVGWKLTGGGASEQRRGMTGNSDGVDKGGRHVSIALLTSSGEPVPINGHEVATFGHAQEVLFNGACSAILNAHSQVAFGQSPRTSRDGKSDNEVIDIRLAAGEIYLEVPSGHQARVTTDNAVVAVADGVADIRAAATHTDVVSVEGRARLAASAAPSLVTEVPAGSRATVRGEVGLLAATPANIAHEVAWAWRIEDADAFAEFLQRKVLPRTSGSDALALQAPQGGGNEVATIASPLGGDTSAFARGASFELWRPQEDRARVAAPTGPMAAHQQKAHEILSRHAANFAKVSSLSLQHRQETVRGGTTGRQGSTGGRGFLLNVEAARQPLFVHVAGWEGSASQVDEIVTPVGMIGSGHFRDDQDPVSAYLDGELRFRRSDLLAHVDRVVADAAMDRVLPGLEACVDARQASRYDVIYLTPSPSGTVWEYWFNRVTGMLDFSVEASRSAGESRGGLRKAVGFEYGNVGGILYWRRWASCDYSEGTTCENTITRLMVNGIPVGPSEDL